MTNNDTTVTEGELHAYVDGELSPERRRAVEAWLARYPEDAAKVEDWLAQSRAIRAHFGAVASEQVPARFDVARITRKQRTWTAVAVAATVAAFIVGGAIGWTVHGASATAPSPFDVFAHEALTAHKLYIAEVRHPIEVKAGEQHLLPWLSKRVGTTLRAPVLDKFGLKLLGGRLLPGPNGPAALFMYEDASGERYTFYTSRTAAPRTALRYNVAGRNSAVQWVEDKYGYVISGPPDRGRLQAIAQTVYDQLEQRRHTYNSTGHFMSRRGS